MTIPAHPESFPVSPVTFGIGMALTATSLINCVTAFTTNISTTTTEARTEVRTERPRAVSTGSTDIVRMQLTAPLAAIIHRTLTPLNTPCPTPSIFPVPDTDSDSEQAVQGSCKELSVAQSDWKTKGEGKEQGEGKGKGNEGRKEGQDKGEGGKEVEGEKGTRTGTGVGDEIEIEMEMDAPQCDDYYLARVGWFPDGSVMAQVRYVLELTLCLIVTDL